MVSILILAFLLVCFVLSLIRFDKVGKPYNGIFVILSGLLLVGIVLIKYENVAVTTPYVSLKREIDSVSTTQKRLVNVVNETIQLLELQRKIPKPMVMWGPELDSVRNDYELKIAEQKKKLRDIAKSE